MRSYCPGSSPIIKEMLEKTRRAASRVDEIDPLRAARCVFSKVLNDRLGSYDAHVINQDPDHGRVYRLTGGSMPRQRSVLPWPIFCAVHIGRGSAAGESVIKRTCLPVAGRGFWPINR